MMWVSHQAEVKRLEFGFVFGFGPGANVDHLCALADGADVAFCLGAANETVLCCRGPPYQVVTLFITPMQLWGGGADSISASTQSQTGAPGKTRAS